MTSSRSISRLTLYRRILTDLLAEGQSHLHSHELARRAGSTPAQVRRDLMLIGRLGSPKRGYDCRMLLEKITHFFEQPASENVALIGVGDLGRALLSYFKMKRSHLNIIAAFDSDPDKAGRVIFGCRCHSIELLEKVILEKKIITAIIAIPAANAQLIADRLRLAGIKGILNFAPVPLHLERSIFVENLDVAVSLEKVAYFAAKGETHDRT